MTKNHLPERLPSAERTLIRGIHLDLTDALRAAIQEKTSRLFRHQDRILRLRVDLEHDKTRSETERFVAKGHIEIGGPDLVASASAGDAYEAVDALVDKLDGLLRRRAGQFKERRHRDALPDLAPEVP
ncbi:ribosome hibernation-promoting factor, HPF/YfiA family [Nibricoccus sp. IMCC34717]|uniref:ribosome hibernation-promoting factor, HPF/YfiA family n=1 Tax=Nibricoccus sp. IMCC34717 TaxID=3034021 RepID=UPI00384AA234